MNTGIKVLWSAACLIVFCATISSGQSVSSEAAQFFAGCEVSPGPTATSRPKISGSCLGHTFSVSNPTQPAACGVGATTPRKAWLVTDCSMDGKAYRQILFDAVSGGIINAIPAVTFASPAVTRQPSPSPPVPPGGSPVRTLAPQPTTPRDWGPDVETKDLVVGTGADAVLNTFAVVKLWRWSRPVAPPGSQVIRDPHQDPTSRSSLDAVLHTYILVKDDHPMFAQYISNGIVGMKVGGKRMITLSAVHQNPPIVFDVELVDVVLKEDDLYARYPKAAFATIPPAAAPMLKDYAKFANRKDFGPVTEVVPPTPITVHVPGQQPKTQMLWGPGGMLTSNGKPAPPHVDESKVVLPAVDVLGIRLGMKEEEARRLVVAHNPMFQVDSLSYPAIALLTTEKDKLQTKTDAGLRDTQQSVRKLLIDHRASSDDLKWLAQPVSIGVGASAGDFGPPIDLSLLFRSDSELKQLMDKKGRTTEQIWFATGGENNDRVVDVFYKGSFAEAVRPSVQSIVKSLKAKYGEPSYTRDTHSNPSARGSLVMDWIFDDGGKQVSVSGQDRLRTELPEIFQGTDAVFRPARLQVTIYDAGSLFASGFRFRLFHEQIVAQTLDAWRRLAQANLAELQRKQAQFTPEEMIEWAKGPPLPHVDAHPADKDASIFAITLGKPLPPFASWFNTDEERANSPMEVLRSAEISTRWGSPVTALRPNKKFYSPAAIFWLGDPNVEIVDGVVQGVRFDEIISDGRKPVIDLLREQFGASDTPCPMTNSPEEACTWTNRKRVVRYVPVDKVETHGMLAGVANAVNPILGYDQVKPPPPVYWGSLVIYTPEQMAKVDAYRRSHPTNQ